MFAVYEVNNDPKLLPNMTLGYHMFDAFEDEIKSVQSVLRILSGINIEAPNYSCIKYGEVAGFVGYSFEMEQILQIYGYTKINYGVTDKQLNNNLLINSFFSMAPQSYFHHLAIVLCLKHFGWNWVGIITPEDESAEAEVRELSRLMTRHGICTEFIVRIVKDTTINVKNHFIIERSRAEVLIICGQFPIIYSRLLMLFDQKRTLILNDSWFLHLLLGYQYMKIVNCSLSVSQFNKPVPKLWSFIHNLDLISNLKDPYLTVISMFYCSSQSKLSNIVKTVALHLVTRNCSAKHFPTADIYQVDIIVYYVYTAVYVLAHAIHEMNMYMDRFPHGSRKLNYRTKAPVSRCNEKCPPGSRKAPNGGIHSCCYDCVPCSEGEIKPRPDSEICQKCPMVEWPNLENTKCIPKLHEFLSYEDTIASFFCFTVILCCAMTCYTLHKFIVHWDTPLVKANNRTLSIILLVSILLSFLCVFLFLGRPLDITCMLKQTLFGIFFSLAISSLIAKSMMVCIAFKATKPSSSWRKWTGVILPNSIVLVCSSVQILICIFWLAMCPPYQEFHISTSPGMIIIQCNEGSDIWFYSMLGYLGLLAAVSFVLAFMVRTLPDNFNEAKYITFSMLVFISVWIAVIPVYLSTRGKNMVAVEIFAILTSSAGILSCVFFPKLYIILINPEINTRNHVLRRWRKA
ncbi:vomeronasal type-2 receptor 26-like [Anomaloglossus baeobatrachus]|uniref:vomeronasal type-2 receptor 26-like n=1 Tax=Anomaloglossus baeobatrachus TaxID=238106 RepID=UPI003F4FF9AD